MPEPIRLTLNPLYHYLNFFNFLNFFNCPVSSLLDYILPHSCHLCGETLKSGERYVCMHCLARLPRTGYHRIPDNPMAVRFMGIVPYERAAGFFFYTPDSELAGVIHDLKYHHFRNLGRYMGAVMCRDLLMSGFLNGVDVLMPVPMHWWRQARRGYNQAEQLCIGLAKDSGIPVSTALKAVRPHRTQTSLSHKERLENTKGIFRLKHPAEFAGKHILLCDDVCTTGATLRSAAEAIVSACPTARISLLSLAVTF